MKRSSLSALLAASLLTLSVAEAKPLHYAVGTGQAEQVNFTSNAPAELIQGETNKATGEIRIDDSLKVDKTHPASLSFSVDLTSLKTGIALRDEHMRDRYLHTGKYPNATFKATQIKWGKQPSLKKGGSYPLTATGDFSLHGVTVKKRIPLTATFAAAQKGTPELVTIKGSFKVPLVDHKIERPEVAKLKLADEIVVTVNFTAEPAKK